MNLNGLKIILEETYFCFIVLKKMYLAIMVNVL